MFAIGVIVVDILLLLLLGCAIGQIQLQVQVGDLLDNKADAIIIEVSANSDMKCENIIDLAM
jgi:hypothetical protein